MKQEQQNQVISNWNGPAIFALILALIGILVTVLIGYGVIRPFSANASPNVYQQYHNKHPNITDSLKRDAESWKVQLGAREGGDCKFEGGALDALQPTNGAVTTCVAQNIHEVNYALQVDFEIKSGFGGGVALRVGQGGYRLDIAKVGTADFVSTANGQYDDNSTLWTGSVNNGVALGPNQTITVFVTVLSNQFNFWVDGVNIGGVVVGNPPPQTGDAIGVFSFNQGIDQGRVSFSNLEIWNA